MNRHRRAGWGPLAIAGLLAGMLAFGCAPADNETASGSGESTPVTDPSPLIIAFQRQKDPSALEVEANRVGERLSEILNHPVEVVVPNAYSATVQALVSNRAHVAFLSSLPYMLASNETNMEILLVELRNGDTKYDSVIVVRADSPYQSLADLRGARMAFTSPTSASGYVFPYAHLVNEGLLNRAADPTDFFGQTNFAGGYDQALLAVLRGQADAAAVSFYTMEGPTADNYLSAADRAQLRILHRVPGVPTHLIAARTDISEDMRRRVTEALMQIANEEPELLGAVYGTAQFQAVDGDSHVDNTRLALQQTGLAPDAVVE